MSTSMSGTAMACPVEGPSIPNQLFLANSRYCSRRYACWMKRSMVPKCAVPCPNMSMNWLLQYLISIGQRCTGNGVLKHLKCFQNRGLHQRTARSMFSMIRHVLTHLSYLATTAAILF